MGVAFDVAGVSAGRERTFDVMLRDGPVELRGPANLVAQRLLVAIGYEIASMAGPIAATTSIINKLAGPAFGQAREDTLPTSLPAESIVYPAVIEQVATADIAPDLLGAIQYYHVRLGHARRATLTYAACDIDLPFRAGVHLEVLANLWRDACAETIALLARLSDETADFRGTRGNIGRARCDEILALAADGAWPCVMDDASVEIPGLAERRRHDRHAVWWPAWLMRGGDMIAIYIENVSEGGFGVTADGVIRGGEPVIIELMGRMLSGHVAWVAGKRFGIRLSVQLGQRDPIIVAASAQRT